MQYARWPIIAGWDKVSDFVGNPFIHPIFWPKQREADVTYLGVCVRFATYRRITNLIIIM